MEALRNEDLSMIGVWGMGGVGKTTLVKQVAQQAEENELFHKVVMVLNISQTPNIAEIQEKIARMLGLKFEAEDDRAGRLRQRLKKEEKILVILDDIWEKLELGEIGIPHGDDHQGCKVLLTSRECWVLSKDMRTQKEFHLQHLSEDEAWNLFKKTAGDSVEERELRPTAVDIAKKCEGLPVAIVTIANALRGERVGVWENALEELRRSAPTNIRGVSKNVYSCLELSYNHLEGDEIKSLFLLCALMGDGNIHMDFLLQYAMSLNLFKGFYSWEKAANKLLTLVESLKVSSLLFDDEDGGNDGYANLFFDHAIVRMHDVVRDVAISIASKDPHQFVVKEAVGLQEGWQWMDEHRKCTRISLKCQNVDELPKGLVCPKLEFFLLDSSNDDEDDDSYLKIPDAFFQDTKQLRVLDLSKVSLAPSPSSLGFLSNLRTLCLNRCELQDIAVIGDLKRLQVLNLAGSKIEQLPKEMMQLRDLRVLDLRNCYWLKVIPRNVISSLSRLEYLRMKQCNIRWEKEGFNSGERINNACVSELKHLSCLRTLEVEVSDPSLLPEDAVLFDNLNLTRYSIQIGDLFWMPNDEYKSSRRLTLNKVRRLHMVNSSKLLKRSQVLGLQGLNDTKDVVYELDKEGFVELKSLSIKESPSIQYILHSTSVELAPPPNTFCMLEQLHLSDLSNLEVVCKGPIPMGFFGDLRILRLKLCERLKYVLSVPTQHGRESLAFPQLQVLELEGLPEVISFYSIGRSSGSEESVTFFNQQVTFPSLEFLTVDNLDNVRALWHNQLPAYSFSKLRELNIRSCNKLLNIFPSNNLKGLQSLQILVIESCTALKEIFDLDGFLELKYLTISWCHSIQYILHSSTLVEWAPPPNAFCMLEKLYLDGLSNLEAVCDGPIPMGSFGNLRTVEVSSCERLKYVLSVPTQHGRESLAFPQLQELRLENLREVISFYSIGRSSGSKESVTFFNQQVSFPALESLSVHELDNVRSLWHNQVPVDSFSKLKKLEISSCNKLPNVFPLSMAKALVQLEDLEINFCKILEAIVANENEDEDEDEARLLVLFLKLTSLSINTLPQLKRFCSGMFILRWPLLKKLEVCKCDEVTTFFQEIGWEGELGNKIQQPLFLIEKVTFPSLEFLTVDNLDNVRALWHNQLPAYSFSKLRELKIRSCNKLLNIFPSNNLKGLQSLQILEIKHCNALEEIFYLDGFLELKSLIVYWCRSIQYILHSSTSVEWAPPPNTFCMLEKLDLKGLSKLEAVCDGPIPMGFFGNLRILEVLDCERLKYVFSIPSTQHGRELLAFPQLLQLRLMNLREVISFYSIGRSSGSEESITFFNQQVAFPALEYLRVIKLGNVRSLWHNQLPTDSFSKLKKLNISSCNKLLNVFPLFVAKALVQLEDLEIKSCGVLEAIVANENEGDEPRNNEIDFTRLERLVLDCLPNLKSFCSARYTFRFPSLEAMGVTECPKMEFFNEGVLDTPRLKGVQMTYYHKECWEGDLNATIHKKFMDQNAQG